MRRKLTNSRVRRWHCRAGAWLDRLRGLARRMCVTATPYAQADLGALQRWQGPVQGGPDSEGPVTEGPLPGNQPP
jgi:hypothetical protein